jgi:hypothetical protein
MGNQWVRRQINQGRAPVQRLMTVNELTEQAGEAKKDKGFKNPFTGKFVTLKKMSKTYKAIIDAVGNYHLLLDGVGKIIALDKIEAATRLKKSLQAIYEKTTQYLQNHDSDKEEETDRNDAVQKIRVQAIAEQKIIDFIRDKTTYHGQTWASVVTQLAPLTGFVGDNLDGSIQENQFHGTNSNLLGKFGGELMTGKELENRGITANSGEGDFYSTGGGAKDFISSGQGKPGMGTAMAYAKAGNMLVDYNPALYTDNNLKNEIAQLKRIVENWKEDLNQVSKDELMKARREKVQFESLLKRLNAEWELRQKLDENHPRRKGQPFEESTYPLLFEFGSQDLNIVNPRGERDLKTDSQEGFERALGGERMIKTQSIDFRIPGRLKRVYCPADKVELVRSRLTEILKHSAFDVIPLELVDEFLSEATKYTEKATLSEMKNNYAQQRSMVLYAYDEGMTNNQEVTSKTLDVRAQELQIIKRVANGARNAEEIFRGTGSSMTLETVKLRLEDLMKKLGVTEVGEIPQKANALGLLPD